MSSSDTVFGQAKRRGPPGLSARIARRQVLSRLGNLAGGILHVRDRQGMQTFGVCDCPDQLRASIDIIDDRFYTSVALNGAIGAAEAYMQGFWSADDLTAVVQLLARNRDTLAAFEQGGAKLTGPARRVLHWLQRNTKSGSRRNIAAHYDLGNDFFRLWLDETMMYSSAFFERDNMTLREASAAKLEMICRKLQLTAEDHVLEIGTGWGGFAIHAARHYGCKVTTTTISREQYEFAKARVAEAGLSGKVTLLLNDYRELKGSFDKLVSIEMVEAVGDKYLDGYFSHCSKLLRPDGMMLMQAITIADQHFDAAIRSVDFIQRYIFPGGFLPSVTRLLQSSTKSTDLRIFHLEDIGSHYARTINCWKKRFWNNIERIRRLDYGSTFVRMWHYYFCYCEGAFTERAIGNVQILFVKPKSRPDTLPTRPAPCDAGSWSGN